MKILLKGLLAVVLLITLSGCISSASNQVSQLDTTNEVSDVEVGITTSVFELTIDDSFYSKIEIEHINGKMISHKWTDISSYGSMTREEVMKSTSNHTEYFKSKEGFTYEIEYGEESFTEVRTIDYTVVDLEDQFFDTRGSTEEQILDYESCKESILSAGYTMN